MSRRFGVIRQIAFVVHDIDAALRYWTETLGVGPFFIIRNVRPGTFEYHGRPSPPPLLSVALGNSGDLQIEIIAQHDDSPSAYRDFLDSGCEGFHHVSAWGTREQYDAAVARERAAGTAVAHAGTTDAESGRFAYFATDSAPGGTIYEVSEGMEPMSAALMQMVADAAKDWDGSDPVRELNLFGV